MGHERGRGLALADFPLALAIAWQRKHGPMSSLWNSLTETVNDYATPLKNSVVDLLNEADEQAADFLTPQQPGVEDLGGNLKQGYEDGVSPGDEGAQQAYADDSPRKYVVKLLKEENESLKSLIHQQAKEIETLKMAEAKAQETVDETPSWPEDDNDASQHEDEISKLRRNCNKRQT